MGDGVGDGEGVIVGDGSGVGEGRGVAVEDAVVGDGLGVGSVAVTSATTGSGGTVASSTAGVAAWGTLLLAATVAPNGCRVACRSTATVAMAAATCSRVQPASRRLATNTARRVPAPSIRAKER